MVINHNMSAMFANRQLGVTGLYLSKDMGSNIVTASVYSQDSNKHVDLNKVDELVQNDDNIAEYTPYLSATKKVRFGKDY